MSHSDPERILLLGATSILGFNLATRFSERIRAFVPQNNPPHAELNTEPLNLESVAWIDETLVASQPSLLIYAHAICHVGNCEKNPAWAEEINVGHVRRLLSRLPSSVRLVYVSSDHVFGRDGAYTESAEPCPISVYGRTRVAAEALVLARDDSLVIRHGLPIGPSFDGRTGHLDWLRYRSNQGLPLTIVEDEARSAVPVDALCERVMALAESRVCGLRHIPATRCIGRPELARFLMQSWGIDYALQSTTRAQQPAPHIGRIEILSEHQDDVSSALKSVVEGGPANMRV